jgi:N-acetylmuramoyl-L-alanine amidase
VRNLLIGLGLCLSVWAWAQSPDTTLHVTSQPAGAKVYVNGYLKGTTPVVVPLASATADPSAYRVTVQLAGYEKMSQVLDISAGDRRSFHVALKRLPDKSPQPAAPATGGSLSGKVICLDPGHPSETSAGTRGKNLTENRANWLVAVQLKALLQSRGAKVVMTKQAENEKVTNQRRAEIANGAGADLMLRLHCDAASARGLSVYYPDRQGTKGSVRGPSPEVISASRRVAKAFYPAAMASLAGKHPGRGIHGDSATAIGSKQGALTGSIFSKVPVLTVEMVVLTNAQDEAFIASQAGRDALVKALAAGVAAAL